MIFTGDTGGDEVIFSLQWQWACLQLLRAIGIMT